MTLNEPKNVSSPSYENAFSLDALRDVLEMVLHGGNDEELNKYGFNLTLKSELSLNHKVIELGLTEEVKNQLKS